MSTGAWGKRAGWLLVCLLLLLSPLPAMADSEEPVAEELTGRCTLTWTGAEQKRAFALTDGRIGTSCRIKAGDALIVAADEDMGTLILRFYQQENAFLLLERGDEGQLLRMRALRTAVCLTVPLQTGCRQVQLLALREELRICEAAIYGPGPLPEDMPHPTAPLEKTDFLLVATHPDDEWVFLGGVYPLYGSERGYAGTVVYVTRPTWERAQEAVNGLWIGGVRTHPFLLGFPDVPQGASQRERDTCKREDVTRELVRLYRRIRPLVVVTQDPDHGEYGHWQHRLSAHAASDAVQLAADPAYDPPSAEQYGTWAVQKLYQHFAEGLSTLELDVDTPLASYGGRSALEVAKAAFQAHRTQLQTPFRPGSSDPNRGDIRHFGLTWSAVGPDTGNDLFEHLLEADLAANWKPTPPPPTPTPVPTPTVPPTPSPTPTVPPTPSPSPTPTPSPVPTAVPTPSPTATPSAWDRAEEKAVWAADHAAPLSAGIVVLLAAAVAGKQLARAHHRCRRLPAVQDRAEHQEGETP